jgi:hypothetical protein
MRFHTVGLALALGLMTGSAEAANIFFSFSNAAGNVNGTVAGQILGLPDDGTAEASAIMITSITPGSMATHFPNTPFDAVEHFYFVPEVEPDFVNINGGNPNNMFTLVGGLVTSAIFLGYSGPQMLQGFMLTSPNICVVTNGLCGSSLSTQNGQVLSIFNPGGATFTNQPQLPEPGALALIGLGLSAMVARRRRR